jgi:hypothetical protein
VESITDRFRNDVFKPYVELLKSKYRFHPRFQNAKTIWEKKLTYEELVNGPFLEKSEIYKEGISLNDLDLHIKTKDTIRKILGKRQLWEHQTEALKRILKKENAVIATGTSSGKTLCYQIPILDELIRNPTSGLRAIIIYPLNALVNDQLKEWERMLADHPEIRFAKYTGQTPNNQSDYEEQLKSTIRLALSDKGYTQNELERIVTQKVEEQLKEDPPNRLNYRDAIRTSPPQVLITNFSMLEYLLERPIDAPIFENARLQFLVLDEAHSYRGVQSTEIAFLIRRLKNKLKTKRLVCIATSATLDKQGDPDSLKKVCRFASALFDDEFPVTNIIYGTSAEPELKQPSFRATPDNYITAAKTLRTDPKADVRQIFQIDSGESYPSNISSLIYHDENLFRLKKEILVKPILLEEAASLIWHESFIDKADAVKGLEALLEIITVIKRDNAHEDLLPTRLHYFIRAQDGLHVCLNKECPGRIDNNPAFFVSRLSEPGIPEGYCPDCHKNNPSCKSKLMEVVACRKCGYLFGALQDLGPRRARSPEADQSNIDFDSFETELSWASESHWSYLGVEDDLPYPRQIDDDMIDNSLLTNPAKLDWCVKCGKKSDLGAGDNCKCRIKNLRTIEIFHRQCPYSSKSKDRNNLYSQEKKLLHTCPNCNARDNFGEPLQRFQESNDQIGLSIAIPLAHFQLNSPAKVSQGTDSYSMKDNSQRKLLCFTDNRQQAATFPSLLEEETFSHDMGSKIMEILNNCNDALSLIELATCLNDMENKDPKFFLPISRLPDGSLDSKSKLNAWIAETFAYFGVPDAARESVEDFGLVSVDYRLTNSEIERLLEILVPYSNLTFMECNSFIQIILTHMRRNKAFTLPSGMQPDNPAFGHSGDVYYDIAPNKNLRTRSWIPRNKSSNPIFDFIYRVFALSWEQTIDLTENIWKLFISESMLISNKKGWKLDHERIMVSKATDRYVCNRCGTVTSHCIKNLCPKKGCDGRLQARSFILEEQNLIGKWVCGAEKRFFTLKSEEHSAQISKDLAKSIEDEFRAEGINILSSTTTFEMGINLGDLQKVLLRNAPPSSASYVQRVGRAGRGENKNSVCVTLCRRTKYDGDMWKDPSRLMSGEVRAPTVFIQNGRIAQRHFNAVVFTNFLKLEADQGSFGKLNQRIPLRSFLPITDEKLEIPRSWLDDLSVHINFLEYLEVVKSVELFYETTCNSIIDALNGFDKALKQTKYLYESIILSIMGDLSALMRERSIMFTEGRKIDDIGYAIKNLLNSDIIQILARRGFLPRYAFPLDSVTLETGETRFSGDSDVALSRDRGIAISEFAPNSQVVAHKKVFTSGGLYIMSKTDVPDRKYYSKCRSCEQIRTASTEEQLKIKCDICQRLISSQDIKSFVEPKMFRVKLDKESKAVSRYRRNTFIRQRQTATHFIDQVDEKLFQTCDLFNLAIKDRGRLFRYNAGPQGKGFILCPKCGYSEPAYTHKAANRHKQQRLFTHDDSDCTQVEIWGTGLPGVKTLAYGHVFQTSCLLIRPNRLSLNQYDHKSFKASLAYALKVGLCNFLELEAFDIGVAWRWLGQANKASFEIVLYDTTPGGAGFVREGYDNWNEIVNTTKNICEKCSCENACYDCLKSYDNQVYHEHLTRHAVESYFTVNHA